MSSIFAPRNLFLIFALFAFSCSSSDKKKTISAPDSFLEYVSGFTSGQVKRSDHIIVKFTKPMVPDDQKGKNVSKSILKFSPAIDGTARWIDTDAIAFAPEKLLPWNTKYTATLNLRNIAKVPSGLSEMVFGFQTPQKQFTVNVAGLSSDSKSEGNYQLKGEIKTSDEFDQSEIEQLIAAKHDGKKIKIEWEHHPKNYIHHFTIKEIIRSEKATTIELDWDGKNAGIKNSNGKEEILVPSLSDFSVASAKVINAPDQYIEIFFSDPISTNIDLRGLITLENLSVERSQVSGNTIKVFPDKRLSGVQTLTVNQDIINVNGYKLNTDVRFTLNFGGLKPEVRLPGKGVIVPPGEGLFFPFEAVSLNAVDVRITKIFTNNIHAFLQENNYNNSYNLNRVGRVIHRSKIDLTNKGASDLNNWNIFKLDLSKLITIENGAIYNVEIAFRKSYSLFDCSKSEPETDFYVPITEEELYPEKNYQSVYYNNYYNWNQYNNACHQAYYSPDRFVNRNLLGSNHGIIAKTDQNGKVYVYVTNLLTAKPEIGVDVKFFDYQNQLITSGKTNSEGMLSITPEREPFLLITQKEQTLGYLKIDNGTMLSTSNFDVEGREVKKGIKGFLYGEREVWRPGDSVFISFILEDKLKNLPHGHPLTFEIFNPKGQLVNRMVTSRDDKYIYPFFFKTNPNDLTGNWQVVLKAGAVQFSRGIRIETIKPNRLKVNLSFATEQLSAKRSTPGYIESRWLHGAPSGGLKAKVDVTFSSITPSFPNFKNYDFSTPYDKFYGEEKTVFDGRLDDEGKALLQFDYQPNNEVSGFLKAAFTTKVFETGGDFSINYFSIPFSPYPNYVGLNINWSYKNWNKLNNDEAHTIEIATVDEKGNPVDLKGIDVKLFELEYRWWYHGNHENLASYAGKTYHKPVYTTKVNSKGGKASFKIDQNEDRWGRHLLLVTSPDGHTTGQVIYFGWSWGREQHKGGAEMLALVTETSQFKVGEKVTVGFPANPGARALVTFENGTGVIGQEWLENLTDFTQYSFTATPQMAPNVYVHIALIQPHGQTINDLPIRLYGVTPIMVEDPNTRLKPEIDMPDEVRPLKEFTIKVSEANKLPMDYTIAIVDEGLLDLTNFKTPDPWASFFAREALGVKTYDLYNFVMGAFGSRLESMFSVGGSDNPVDLSKKQAQRFVPVVSVLGPFHLKAKSKGVHKVTLPQYVGGVRVMVIAAENGQYGRAEKSVAVKEPLMVLATLPRVLSPGETVDLPVTIFAMKDNIRNVKVKIVTNHLLETLDGAEKTIVFNQTGEQNVFFKVRSSDKTGIAKVKVEVSSGNERSFHEIELDIRQPNPPTVETLFKPIKPGEKWETTVTPFGMEGSNQASVELSGMPPLNLGKRLEYLMSYPHGCVEQVTSAVFPQLYLPLLSDLSKAEQEKVSQNIQRGIEKLQRFQTSGGGFGYWPGNSASDPWSSCYAGYFLLEARKAGYLVPGNMLNDWLSQLRREASAYNIGNNSSYTHFTQAFRLYLLALAGETQVSAMNRLRAVADNNNQTKWLLAGAYAQSGMKEAALKLIDFRNMKPDKPHTQSYGSFLRDESIILQTLLALGETEHAAQLAMKISEQLSSDTWFSTQTTAYALLALTDFVLKTGAKAEMHYQIGIDGKSNQSKSNKMIDIVSLNTEKGSVKVMLENKGKGTLFATIANQGVKAGVDETSEMRGLQLDVTYSDKSGKTIDVKNMLQSTDFIAHVKVSNTSGTKIENVALSQMFPSGWEVINSRLFGDAVGKMSQFDYQDIRDDRVYTYFGLNPFEAKTFLVNLNASYSGEYLLPAITCGAMYDNSWFAKTPGTKVKVLKQVN